MQLRSLVRDIPDFPRPGVSFKDITPILKDGAALREVVQEMATRWRGEKIGQVVGVESRGFLFGAPLAYELGVGFAIIRKPGKLPSRTLRIEYELEYGKDALEVHTDAIEQGTRVLMVDDLLATGGTIAAASELVRRLQGVIAGYAFLIELDFLGGRARLPGEPIQSLIRYE